GSRRGRYFDSRTGPSSVSVRSRTTSRAGPGVVSPGGPAVPPAHDEGAPYRRGAVLFTNEVPPLQPLHRRHRPPLRRAGRVVRLPQGGEEPHPSAPLGAADRRQRAAGLARLPDRRRRLVRPDPTGAGRLISAPPPRTVRRRRAAGSGPARRRG